MTPELAKQKHAAHMAEIAAAVKKHAVLRAKLEEVLNRTIPPAGVFDHEGEKLDRMMLHVTKASRMIVLKPWIVTEGGGIPGFLDYKDWTNKIHILIAPNKAKRRAYLLLFPNAEAID